MKGMTWCLAWMTVLAGGSVLAEEKDQSGEQPPPTAQEESGALAANEAASRFLTRQKGSSHAVTGGVHGKVYQLFHLPDGSPAFPLPAHVSEEDYVELWLVLPTGAKATVDIVACDKVPDARIRGSYKDVVAAAAQKRPEGLDHREPEFGLVAYPKRLRCSGTLTYKISPTGAGTGGSTTTSLTIDPIYRFEWSVGYGFDFGRPRQIGLADRQPSAAGDVEKVVVDPRGFTGRKPIVTLLVDVCGTNPNALDWCDRLVNPTIWVDPTRLEEGFGAGLTFRPFFGWGILAGVSVFQSRKLADGVAVAPGDTWTAPGDLPTKKEWDRNSLGLMLAVTVDTELAKRLFE